MIDWKAKLGSRKFWALLAGLAASVFGGILSADDVTKIVGIIGAFGSVSIYILGEAYVDANRGE